MSEEAEGQAGMTPRRRLLTALAHKEADRVLLHFSCEDDTLKQMIRDANLPPKVQDRFMRGDVDQVTFADLKNRPQFAPYHKNTPEQVTIGDWGQAFLRHSESGENLYTRRTYYPLADMTDAAELDDYPWPDMSDPLRWSHIEAEVAAAQTAGRGVIGQMSQTVVEMSYELRPMERLFLDFYDNPAFVERLFAIITDIRCEQAERFARAGVDVLRIGDDLASQEGLLTGVETYRKWIKPCHARVIAAARDVRPDIPVLYHSDGNIEQLIPELIDIGVTAVNPVQPECIDPVMVKRRWGDEITIWGAVATQSLLAFATEADVDAAVDATMASLAAGGGYVLNFINTAWSPTSRRNLLRYLIRAEQAGVY